jgi:NTE family protein
MNDAAVVDHSNSKKRAVVLGGGGPVGVAWELGLAAGLASGGIDLADADLIVGTSAGSIAGAMLAGGDDPAQLSSDIESIFQNSAGSSGATEVSQSGLAGFMEMIFDSGQLAADPVAAAAHLNKIGQYALDASTIAEEAFVNALASVFAGREWPEGFVCTAIDTANGEFQPWDSSSNVALERAIASSCSVPGVYPPITINGRRFMDGGARSGLNADLASGYDTVVVVSVTLLELPPGLEDERIGSYLAKERAVVEALNASGSMVELIVPDMEFLMISGMGLNLMDFTAIVASAEAGQKLGKAEAERIAAIW